MGMNETEYSSSCSQLRRCAVCLSSFQASYVFLLSLQTLVLFVPDIAPNRTPTNCRMKIPTSTTVRGEGLDSTTMTPMIDVVFLLLVFFVWTASISAVEYLLPSNLTPAPGSAAVTDEPPPPPDFDPVVVKVVWLGDRPGWIINDRAVRQLDEVRQTLAAVVEIKRDLPVIIDPAKDVPLGDVIDVYDLARLTGFEKIQFAASESI